MAGLKHLKTRYYDPEVGRFINADVLMSTGQGGSGVIYSAIAEMVQLIELIQIAILGKNFGIRLVMSL